MVDKGHFITVGPSENVSIYVSFKEGPYIIDESKAFYLPSGLTEIEEEAFANVDARYFIIPETVTAIGVNSFPQGSYVYLDVSKIPNLCKEVITGSGVFYDTNGCESSFMDAVRGTEYLYVDKWGNSSAKRTQYRYRTRETTASSQPTLDGWSIYDETVSDWSDWTSNGAAVVSSTQDREVKTVYHEAVTGVTAYHYHRFRYTNSSGTVKYTYSESYALNNGGYREDNEVDAANRLPAYRVYDGYQSYGEQYKFWFYEEPVTGVITQAWTEYQYRTRTRTYQLERWTEWSEWQDEPVVEDSMTEVETREI